MSLSNQELNALLEIFAYAGDLDALSEMIEFDVHNLRSKLVSEMMMQSSYELECG